MSAASLPAGHVLSGRYELGDILGKGGMSTVYRAEDKTLRRAVAVKVMADWLRGDEAYGRRFTAEAQAAAGLNHPNIAAVHDTGGDGEHRYIVMELVEGTALDECPSVNPDDAVAVAVQVAEALEYAHQNGVIHCDVKPGNILVDVRKQAKIVDFGIARAATQTWAMATTVLGTAAYMSPEVVEGGRPDARADVYSLAVVLYEQLAGRLPFDGESVAALTAQRLVKDPTPLRRVAPEVPAQLERPIMKALSRNPQKRPISAHEFAQDLRDAQSELNTPRTRPVAVKTPPKASAAHSPKPGVPLEDGETLWRGGFPEPDKSPPQGRSTAPAATSQSGEAPAPDAIWRTGRPYGQADGNASADAASAAGSKRAIPKSGPAAVITAGAQGSWWQRTWLRVLAVVALLAGLFLVAFAVTRLVVSESGSTPSTADYAADVQAAFDQAAGTRENLAADVQAAGEGPFSFDDVRELYLPFLAGYIESSRELLGALRESEPPDELQEVHGGYIDALDSETAALQAFADGFAGVETVEELATLQSTGFQETGNAEDAACQALEDAVNAGGQPANFDCAGPLPGIPSTADEGNETSAEDGGGEGNGQGRGNGRGNGNGNNDDDD